MLSQKNLYKPKFSRKVWLYYVVFAGRLSVFLVFVLCLSFLIQPIDQALAEEEEQVEEEVEVTPDEVEMQDEEELESESESTDDESDKSSSVDSDTQTEDEISETSDEDDISEVNNSNSESDNNLDKEFDSEIVDTSIPTSSDEVTSDNEENSDDNELDNQLQTASGTISTSSDDVSSSTTDTANTGATSTGSSTTDQADQETDNTNPDNSSTSTDDTAEETDQSDVNSDTPSASSTDQTDEVSGSDEYVPESNNTDADPDVDPGESRQLVTEDNFYQFSKQSCAMVGDGTYHCSTKTDNSIDTQSLVYSERDETGDMEIFLKTSNDQVRQITDNDFEDTAPHFDAESMRVVWQRMIDGRQQIIAYDLVEKEEKQLTFSRTNNMEPKVSVEGFVWQAWDGNDWEIMFFDGNYTDQLTDNNSQDVGPVIEDGYVMWTILGGKDQEARVYSIASGETLTITGHDGGEIANPRFVLVYDTKFDNGDIITKGFDPATGLSAPISAKPAPEPIDIPETDTTGEIRALIQNKSSQKEQEIVSAPATGPSDASSSSTASTTDTLDLTDVDKDLEIEADAPSSTEPADDFELTEYDLVITPEATSSQPDANDEVILEVPKNASSTQ